MEEHNRRKAEIMDKMIQKAKQKVWTTYTHSDLPLRRWYETTLDSYGPKEYRITIFVLGGCPVKGYIIANYGTRLVRAFGCHDKLLKTYNAADENQRPPIMRYDANRIHRHTCRRDPA